jgi:predicted transcriptional regulator
MDIELKMERKKLELIQWLSTLEDEVVIDKIADLRSNQKDWWDTISDDEKASIEKGLEDADSGKLTPHSEARKLYAKWL